MALVRFGALQQAPEIPMSYRCYPVWQNNLPFLSSIPELMPFAVKGQSIGNLDAHVPSFVPGNEYAMVQTKGWVAGSQRAVDVYWSESGFFLKVDGCGDYFVSPNGELIGRAGFQPERLNQLDCEILLGPVIVLALALRNIWSLHASAAMFQGKVIVFLGESGQGKSTLAAYLSQSTGWRRVADDILPATIESSGVKIWPHFPQLKLPSELQPWIGLPEQLPLGAICMLEATGPEQAPELHKLTVSQAAQVFIGHIAGTRMFPTDLLKKHLEFSAQAAKIPAYRLVYPHSRKMLPQVRGLLEELTEDL